MDSVRAREPLDFSVDLSQEIIGSRVCHLHNERKMNLSSGQPSGVLGSRVGEWGNRVQGGEKWGGTAPRYPVPAWPGKTWDPHAGGKMRHRLRVTRGPKAKR